MSALDKIKIKNRVQTNMGPAREAVDREAGDGSLGRLDLHNSSVDENAARAGFCATVHLPSGRVWVFPVHHHGSCCFVQRDEELDIVSASMRRLRRF